MTTDAWDGRPENPERDGWHLLNGAPHLWDAGRQMWKHDDGFEVFHTAPEQAARQGWNYSGPLAVLTRAEVAVREAAAVAAIEVAAKCLESAATRALAQARDDEREACVERMQEEGVFGSSGEDMKERLIEVVRARGKEGGNG